MLLIKSRKQLIFSLTETTVSSRDERAHAPLSLSLSLSFCYDTLSPARHFRVSCTAVENFCHATSGMPPTSLETLLHQPISTISSFSAIFFRSPFHGTAMEPWHRQPKNSYPTLFVLLFPTKSIICIKLRTCDRTRRFLLFVSYTETSILIFYYEKRDFSRRESDIF